MEINIDKQTGIKIHKFKIQNSYAGNITTKHVHSVKRVINVHWKPSYQVSIHDKMSYRVFIFTVETVQ